VNFRLQGLILTNDRVERRLVAVLAADVAGYSRLMGLDEEGTLARLKAARKTLVDPTIAAHRGRIVKTTGDGMLVEFASAVDAVRSAVEIQHSMAKQNATVPQDQRIEFRIGIHVGDIIFDDNDIFGDGVNIAARLEGIAESGGVCMSDDTYRQVRGKVEIACDDLGPQTLKNIAEAMRTWRVQFGERSAAKAQPGSLEVQAPALVLPDKPSIAVLPFQNMSGDPEQEYFADGMVEDIITALSRFKSLFVIARNSSFTYKSKAIDIKQVGRELGVRYVLEGSVRKAAGRVRITGQLIEAASGAHLWADKFDGSLDDIFELQDSVTSSVVGAIAPALDRAEIERATRRPIDNLDAYDCYLRGLAKSYAAKKEAVEDSLSFFYRAIELDSDLSAAYGMAAWCYAYQTIQGWILDRRDVEAEVKRLAFLASDTAQDDGLTLCRAGFALVQVCQDIDTGAAMIDKGLSLNENLALGWRWRAANSLFLGEHEDAINYASRSMRLSPLDPTRYATESTLAAGLLFLQRYDEALQWAGRSLATHPTSMLALRTVVIANALTSNLEKAREALARLRHVHPDLRLSGIKNWLPYRRSEDIEIMIQGFRLAGLPE
jgi:adenylate cyclase